MYEPDSGSIRRDLELRGYKPWHPGQSFYKEGWGLHKDVAWRNGVTARIWVKNLATHGHDEEYGITVEPLRHSREGEGKAWEYRDFREIERKNVLWSVDSIERKMSEQDYDTGRNWHNNVPMPDHYWGQLAYDR